MSQRSSYLNRLHDELMAAGHRLHEQRLESEGEHASPPGAGATPLGRALGMPGAPTAHRWRSSPRQRTRRARAALALGAAIAIAAAAAVVLTISGQPAGTEAAYAGWTASPTAPASGQIAAAEAACRGHIAKKDERERHAHGTVEGGGQPIGSNPHVVQPPAIAPGELQTVLSDTRGPYTMLIFEADEGRAKETCLTDSGSPFYGSSSYEPHPTPVPSGAISVFYNGVVGAEPEAGRPNPYTYIDGQVGSGVTSVSVELADGTQVQASVMGGWYLAWWPGTEKALNAQVTDTRGTTSTRSLGH